MNSRENQSQSLNTTPNSRASSSKSAHVEQKSTMNSSSLQLVKLLVSSDFSSLPSASCHETIKLFLHIQNLLIFLSSISSLDEFYEQVEKGLSSIFQSSKVSLWIPFPSQHLLVRPTDYQTKSIPQKYKNSKDGSNCSVILKDGGECLGILDIECESEIPERSLESKSGNFNEISFNCLSSVSSIINDDALEDGEREQVDDVEEAGIFLYIKSLGFSIEPRAFN